jgi:hypothetical protein
MLENKKDMKQNIKPIKITYIDMKKRRNKEQRKESIITNETSGNEAKASITEYPSKNIVDLTSFQKGNKIRLATYRYPAKQEKKGVVYIIHSLFENANKYADTADKLASEGFEVISFDMRGHGNSEGTKEYIYLI